MTGNAIRPAPPGSGLVAAALVAGLMLLALPSGAAAGRPDRHDFRADTRMVAPKTDQAPVIDGRVGEDEWATAAVLEAATDEAARGIFTHTVIWRFAWDEDYLYFAAQSPAGDTGSHDKPDAAGDDSYEFFITRPDGRAWVHVAATAEGEPRIAVHLPGRKDPQPDPNLRVVVSRNGGKLDVEMAVPVRPLGQERGNRSGEAWRVLPVRNFRGGMRATATMPCGSRALRCDRRHPLLLLHYNMPFARVRIPWRTLAAARPEPEVTVLPSGRGKTAQPVIVLAQLLRSGQRVAQTVSTLEVAPDSPARWSKRLVPRKDADPDPGGEHRIELTIKWRGREIFHTHLTYAPAGVAAAAAGDGPAGERTERVLMIDPPDGIPSAFAEALRPYAKLPRDHRLRLTVRAVADPPGKRTEVLRSACPIDARGRKSGEERCWGPGGKLLRTVTHVAGERHGLERAYDKGRVRAEIPWEHGMVEGTRRVYGADGQVRLEMPYKGGVPSGRASWYDDEGRVVQSVEYSGGIRNGEWTQYWPRRIKRTVPYEHGRINGVVRDYWENGQLKMSRPFRQDVMHGVEKQFDREGKLTTTRYWLDGDRVTEAKYQAATAGP